MGTQPKTKKLGDRMLPLVDGCGDQYDLRGDGATRISASLIARSQAESRAAAGDNGSSKKTATK